MASPQLDKAPFTIDCLPYGVVSESEEPQPKCAVAIGEHVLVMASYAQSGALEDLDSGRPFNFIEVFSQPTLNAFAALPSSTRRAVRERIQSDLKAGKISPTCFAAMENVKNHLPMQMGGFSDFYTSLEHCQNCSGEMSSASIAKNWWHAPSVYNSRVSSVVPTPSDIHRPKNVYFSAGMDSEPTYGPTLKMDYELEMGFFVSQPVKFGQRMPIGDARDHIFGFVLLNDWSARDHQLFEMRPLGPFHSKGFGTSISNWIVPIEALEPFSCEPNTKQDPAPFEHLKWPTPKDGALNIKLSTKLVRKGKETVLGTSNLRYLYWTPYQQLTHHAASGCGMQTGDLIGTGTISGASTNDKGEKFELGCLYEAERLKQMKIPSHSGPYQEGYLEDDDEIVLEGWCENDAGEVVLGFGECRGKIVAPS